MNRRDFFKAAGLSGALLSLGLPNQSSADEGDRDVSLPAAPALPNDLLANSISELKPDAFFDVVVIGSGYGGSILAARLSAGLPGKQICLLERGKEWKPGTFPQKFDDTVGAWKSPWNPLGLYALDFNSDVDVFHGSGLGGTSLVNANIAIKPDDETLKLGEWPQAIRDDHQSGKLDEYYEKARSILQPESYPKDRQPFLKGEALRLEAEKLNQAYLPLEMAVNLTRADGEKNAAGTIQNQCRLCGDCITGCNYGAKNTVYMNYLPMSKRAGAKIFTQIEVSHLTKNEDGTFTIFYDLHSDDGKKTQSALNAGRVILSAGVLGSSQILLRSRLLGGLALSETLGTRFSANGDFIGMNYNSDRQMDTVGFGTRTGTRADIRNGPTIDSMVDCRYEKSENKNFALKADLKKRFLIQNAAIPSGMVSIVKRFAKFKSLPQNMTQFLRILKDEISTSSGGSLNHSLIYLGMGHDSSGGKLELGADGQVHINWPQMRQQPLYKDMEAQMRDQTEIENGLFQIPNPRTEMNGSLMTVHPLGGCPMGEDVSHGVVDDRGRVFDPSRSGAFHDGLYVADASIIPIALGVNPFLTISALSERIADFILSRKI